MRHRARPLILLSLIAAVVFTTGCGSSQPESVDPASQDPLWADVIDSHTSGLVSKSTTIRVRFADDVIPEERVGEDASTTVTVEPPVRGSLTFGSRRDIVLVPDTPLVGGQRYRVTLRRRDLVGIPERLREYAFDFAVIEQQFEIEIHGLTANADDDSGMVLSGVVRTADVERADVIETMFSARFLDADQPLQWRHSGDGKAHEFEIRRLARQGQPQTLRLSWNASAIGLDHNGERDIEIPAVGVFEVTRVQSVREAQPYLQVYFSDALDPRQNLNGLVRLGDSSPRTRIEGNVLKVYPEADLEGAVNVVLEPGIRNDNGNTLSAQFTRAVVFQTQKPQVRFVGTGVILPDNPVLSIPFEAVGVDAVRITAFRIYENNVSRFLQANQLDGSEELGRVGRYLWRRTIQLSPPEPGRWNRYTLDATELFENNPGGMFRLALSIHRADATTACTGPAPPDVPDVAPANNEDLWVQEHSNWGYYEEYYGQNSDGSTWEDRNDPCKDAYYQYAPEVRAERNFLSSNIGLLVKRKPAGGLFIVATDLRTSEPMSGVNLTVMNFQDQAIGEARSNANGFAELDTTQTPFYLLAERGGEKGYLKLSKGSALPVSHLDVGGENVTRGIKGVLYGERGVWRPGDEIFLTFVLEDEDGVIPSKHPVTLDLVNPRGQLVDRQTNTTPVGRFYKFALKTEDGAPTGVWSATAKIGGATFSKSLRVETVMPNRLKVELDFGAERLESTDTPIEGELFGQWLSGATASGLDADVQVLLRPTPTRFDRNTDFEFDDPTREFTGEPETIFEGSLGPDGLARFNARFELEQSAPGMLNASFNSRVFENGGAFSTSRTTLPFSPYEHYVGVKLPKGDATRNMLLTDVDHTVELATLSADGEPVSVENIRVSLYKIHWKWWWDKSGDSLAQYAAASHAGIVAQDTVSTAAGQGSWQFRIDYPAWGRYIVRACDTAGGHCSAKVFYIDWPGWAGRAQEQAGPGANTLAFVADKPSYTVGDVANIQLPEATEGRALVTIESGTSILDQRWVELEPGEASKPLTLPITSAMSPNVYVSVTLVQPHAGKSNDRPIRLYGIIPLMVTDPATHLKPTLDAPEEWRPQTTASIKVSEATGQAMTYTVAIVDEGLLGLTGFKTPNLHDHFYQREALGISTWDLFDDVVGAYGGELERLLALGGGDGGDIDQERERKRFPPVVTFLGPFELERRAETTHTFELPQYVGAVRVMVVAGSDGAYGSAEKSVFVRQPLMLLPTMPRVIGPNEKLKVPVSTFVMEETIRDVTLTIETDPAFEIIGSDTVSLRFEEPAEQMGFFELAVGPSLGKANVRVSASSGRHRAEAAIDIDVRSANPPTTRMMRMVLEPGESWETHVEPHGLRGSNHVTLEVSAVPPMDLERRLDYLIRYPHGCVEQMTSAVFPQLYLPSLTKLDETRREAIERNIQTGIDRLRGFQTPMGSFVYWPGGFWVANTSNNWATSYVGHFLIEADRLGYHVPAEMMANWVNHQRANAHAWVGGSHDAELDQAYRLYTLALANAPEMGAMNRLRETSAMPPEARWQLAAAYRLAGLPDAASELVRGTASIVTHDGRPDPTFGSELRNRAIVLASMVTLGQRAQADELVRAISEQLASNRWHSTQSVAYALLSLASYAGGTEIGNPVFDYVAGRGASERVTMTAPIESYPLGVPDSGSAFTLTNASQRRLYANVILVGTPEAGAEKPSAEGLRVAVRYRDLDGQPLDVRHLRQGEDFVAEMTITNEGDAVLTDLALSQILPSGWEILNTRLDAEEGEIAIPAELDYEDVRDDRVYRYFGLKPQETKSFSTLLNAAYAGRYYLPSVSVEAMYDASKNGRTAGQWVEVDGQ
jgi:hypothetical protein